MDPPRIHHGDAEEKSSCESGWTMYIEDTFHGNHHSDDDDDVKEVDDNDGGDDSSDDESDDSMTSDASSWPSTQLPLNTKSHEARKNNNAKQVNHQAKNQACETSSEEEEETRLKARTRTTATSRVQSRSKVSKTK